MIQWGVFDIIRLKRLLRVRHFIQSEKTKTKNINNKKERKRKKKKLKRNLLRLNEHMRNLVEDLHRKMAKWLCLNYKYIYITKLNFHSIDTKSSNLREQMAVLKHCTFRNYLKMKGKKYETGVIELNESYTSKTCCSCGTMQENLKNKDILHCNTCGLEILRDLNGAINIMFRYLTKRAVINVKVNCSYEAKLLIT